MTRVLAAGARPCSSSLVILLSSVSLLLWAPQARAFTPVGTTTCQSRLRKPARGAWGVWKGLSGQREEEDMGATEELRMSPVVRDILALDFDGVVCDSSTESGRAAFRSVKRLWPTLVAACHDCSSDGKMMDLDKEEAAIKGGAMGQEDEAEAAEGQDLPPAWLSRAMRALRPVVETGYENILLARMCIEQYLQGGRSSSAIAVADIMAEWQESLRGVLLQKYGVTAQELVDLFGSVRDDWMAEDPKSWLGANAFYTGSDLSMACPRLDTYVITTKQARFVDALLQHKGVKFPRERIFGLGSGPKTDVLARLVRATRERASSDASVDREAIVHFVEDRIETLERVCADPRLQNVRLYFADWGFSSPGQRERAHLNPRITVLDLADFSCMCRAMDPYRESYPCFAPTCGSMSPEVLSFSPRPTSSSKQGDERDDTSSTGQAP